MKYDTALIALAGLVSMAVAEVPGEHSHDPLVLATDKLLKLNNPLDIQDAVFSLLGNAAAGEGAPKVQNLDCLQQIVADQAFTNAKAAGDVNGQATAIQFRALERNTGKVGLASVLCNETAVNAEIAAITQHQDPASKEASGNAAIEIAVAEQIALLGISADQAVQLAIATATFPPGDVNDNTGKGKTCDVAGDKLGCIVSQNLLTPAAKTADLNAAVAKVAVKGAGAAKASGQASAAAGNATAAAAAPAADASAAASGTVNVQKFTGTLGGAAPPVESSDVERPFDVKGSTFLNIGAAIQRSCDVQHNACANAANSGQLAGGSAQCEDQQKACVAANAAGAARLRRSSSKARRAAFSAGTCGSPAIEFAVGLDGRKEASFQAVNQADFNHGSALNIKVISDFICDQLVNKCKAAQVDVDACKAASTAAQGAKGQASADAFNNALGV